MCDRNRPIINLHLNHSAKHTEKTSQAERPHGFGKMTCQNTAKSPKKAVILFCRPGKLESLAQVGFGGRKAHEAVSMMLKEFIFSPVKKVGQMCKARIYSDDKLKYSEGSFVYLGCTREKKKSLTS